MGTINFHTSNINDGSVLSFRPYDKYIWGGQDVPNLKDLESVISHMNENLELDIRDMLGSDSDIAYNVSKYFKINIDVGYYEGLAISLNYEGPSIEIMLINDGYTPYDVASEIKMKKDLGFSIQDTNGRLDLNNDKMLEYVLNEDMISLTLDKYNLEYMDGENYIDFINRYSKYYNIPLDTMNIDDVIFDKISRLSNDEFYDLIVNKLYKNELGTKDSMINNIKNTVSKYVYFTEVLAQQLGGEREYPGWMSKVERINIEPNKDYDREFEDIYQDNVSDISFEYSDYASYDINDLLDKLKVFEQDLDNIEYYIKGLSDTLTVRNITYVLASKIVDEINAGKYHNFKEELFNRYFDEMIVDDLYEFCEDILSASEMEKLKHINFYNYKEVIENIIEKAYNDDESWML